MATYIDPKTRVLDLGCGKMWLSEVLPKDCIYVPVDYVKRSDKTLVFDFNKYEFPGIPVDVAFVSGCLEYVEDFGWFIGEISKYSQTCIVSYCLLEQFPDIRVRRELAWVNNLDKLQLINLFVESGFKIIKEDITQTNNSIFIFKK